ncbi:MAG: phage portal protein [Chloroflexi bacterium]|nr:MAG: phage portal protein [Chloroflexota bacterium]
MDSNERYLRALKARIENPNVKASEVAQQLGVSVSTVRRYWQRGVEESRRLYQRTLQQENAAILGKQWYAGVVSARSMRTYSTEDLFSSYARYNAPAAALFGEDDYGYANAFNLSAALRAAIHYRAEKIATLPYVVKRSDTSSNIPVQDDQLISAIIDNFAATIRLIELDLCVFGVSYWSIIEHEQEGALRYVFQRWSPVETYRTITRDNVVYHAVDPLTLEYQQLSASEVIDFGYYYPNEYTLQSPVRALIESLRIRHDMFSYFAAFFHNDARPNLILSNQDPSVAITSDEAQRILEQFAAKFAGPYNSHKPVLFTRPMQVTPIQSSIQELYVRDLDEALLREIAMVFGVPMSVLNANDAANYATAREHTAHFYNNTILPQARRIVSIINQRLLHDSLSIRDFRIVIDTSQMPELRVEDEAASQYWLNMFQSGVITLNEMRNRVGLPALEKDFIVAGSMISVDSFEREKHLMPNSVGITDFFRLPAHSPTLSVRSEWQLPDNKHYRNAYLRAVIADLGLWQRLCKKDGRTSFKSEVLPASICTLIQMDLERSADDKHRAQTFERWRNFATRSIEERNTEFASIEEVAEFWQNIEQTYNVLRDTFHEHLRKLFVCYVDAYVRGKVAELDQATQEFQTQLVQALKEPRQEFGGLNLIEAVYAAGIASAEMILQKQLAPQSVTLQATRAATPFIEIGLDMQFIRESARRFFSSPAISALLPQIADTTRKRIENLVAEGGAQQDIAALIQDALKEQQGGINTLASIERAAIIAQDIMTKTYADAVVSDWSRHGVRYIRWRTANDERVCPICVSLNNKVGGITTGIRGDDDVLYTIPAHVGCRCFYSPVINT